jgi:hypothetical protein
MSGWKSLTDERINAEGAKAFAEYAKKIGLDYFENTITDGSEHPPDRKLGIILVWRAGYCLFE